MTDCTRPINRYIFDPSLRVTSAEADGTLRVVVGGTDTVVAASGDEARALLDVLRRFSGVFDLLSLNEVLSTAPALERLKGSVVEASPLSGSLESYGHASRVICEPRYVFMNHGFATEDEDFSWLQSRDEPQKYSVNLVRHLLAGVDLDGGRVLDVGCGRGGACSFMNRYMRPRLVVGVDLAPGNIQFCAAAHRQAGCLEFAVGDAHRLPFADCSFDLVTSIESSHSYPARRVFLSEAERILRPGGLLCFTDNFSSPEDVETIDSAFSLVGFRVERSEDITTNVALALKRDRVSFERLISRGLSDRRLASIVLRNIYGYVYPRYRQREWLYIMWHLRKEACASRGSACVVDLALSPGAR